MKIVVVSCVAPPETVVAGVLSSAERDSTTGKAISENKCGLLVYNLNSWSDQMSKFLIMDKDVLQQMGNNSFVFGMKRYSKKNGLLKMDKLFKEKF